MRALAESFEAVRRAMVFSRSKMIVWKILMISMVLVAIGVQVDGEGVLGKGLAVGVRRGVSSRLVGVEVASDVVVGQRRRELQRLLVISRI